MRQVYTVHVNGKAVYHGINKSDALEHVIVACENEGNDVRVQRNPWPESRVKFQCCAGKAFHSSDCPVVQDGE